MNRPSNWCSMVAPIPPSFMVAATVPLLAPRWSRFTRSSRKRTLLASTATPGVGSRVDHLFEVTRPPQYPKIIVDEAIGVSHVLQGQAWLRPHPSRYFVPGCCLRESPHQITEFVRPQDRIRWLECVEQASYPRRRQILGGSHRHLRAQTREVINRLVESGPAHKSK